MNTGDTTTPPTSSLVGLKVTISKDGCWVRWPDGKQQQITLEQANEIWLALGFK